MTGETDDQVGEAVAYLVWQVDCPCCGTVISYNEDSHPDACEECGAKVVKAT